MPDCFHKMELGYFLVQPAKNWRNSGLRSNLFNKKWNIFSWIEIKGEENSGHLWLFEENNWKQHTSLVVYFNWLNNLLINENSYAYDSLQMHNILRMFLYI